MAGLYLHIPFCKSRCHYCDFFSTTSLDEQQKYLSAIEEELRCEQDFLGVNTLETIYLGGGTPSILCPDSLERIFGVISQLWDCSSLREVTIEANPDDLSVEYLKELARLPIDRLSIGIQSFDDDLLRFMNRRHTSESARNAIHAARDVGFDNISADLIYGIPGMTIKQWQDSLDALIALNVEHISAYHLTIEPQTAFGRRKLQPAPESISQKQYQILCDKLAGAGYEHYEISNFALPGRHARHNSNYWQGEAYLGIGPSAHSYDGKRVRRWNCSSLEEYISSRSYDYETLSEDELYNEYVMTSLRTSRGVDTDHIRQRFEARRLLYFNSCASAFLETGMLIHRDGRIVIPESYFLVSDSVISSLFI